MHRRWLRYEAMTGRLLLHLARALVSSPSTSEAEAFTSIETLMRRPWSASSKFWIGGDDPGSDGVCGRLSAGVSICSGIALPKRRQPASVSGGDERCVLRPGSPEMTLGNVPDPLQVWAKVA
jgi:hypothetical protein